MAQYCINSCRGQHKQNYWPPQDETPKITDKLTWDLSRTSDLEVVPDIHHAALYKGLSSLFLQWWSSHIQSMDISQVVDATNIHPVPRANLYTRKHHVTLNCSMPKDKQLISLTLLMKADLQ